MSDIAALVANNLDIWASATQRKSGAGRGGGKRISLYGIERLRALIFDLAVRGKLVAQDEKASDTLRAIADERKAMAAEKLIRIKTRIQVSKSRVDPFEVPHTWQWTELGELGGLENGDRGRDYPNKSALKPSGVPFVNAGHLQNGGVDASQMTYISEDHFERLSGGKFQDGDILYCLRGSLGKAAQVVGIGRGAIASSLVIIRLAPSFIGPFMMIYLGSSLALAMVRRYDNGTAQPNLSSANLEKFLVPVPPLAEQRRIVAKVDELMALCDALERESADGMAAHQTLVEELLATLVNSASAADLASNWARLEEHFDTLFTTDASIEALKQTILDLAVRGRLVEQNAVDETASVLATKLRKQFADQSNGNSRGRQSKGPIRAEALAFGLPAGWAEVLFCEIGETFIGLTYSPKDVSAEGTPVLRSSNVQGGEIDLTDLVRVRSQVREKLLVNDGDLLICVRNGSRALVGKCALISNLSEPTTFGAFMAIFKSPLNKFVKLYVESPTFRRRLLGVETTTINQITQANLKATPIAIPPLAEQCRIIAKVDALMAICEALKARLAEAAQTQRHLADAITERAAA